MEPIVDVIIETPKGSGQKYYYDPQKKSFKLKKILPLGMVFPFDFGFIPGTKGEDGDPVDVLVISEYGSFTGCSVSCRIIGSITALQSLKGSGEKQFRNDRVLAVPEASLFFKHIESPGDLPGDTVTQLTVFFETYNRLEDKLFIPLGILDAAATLNLIKD